MASTLRGEDNFSTKRYKALPVGSIIPIHKDFGSTPTISSFWAPCNGATISDAGSVYNGLVLPNLNVSYKGVSRRGWWLRSGTVSGLFNDSTYTTNSNTSKYGGSGSYYGAWVFNRFNCDGTDSSGTVRINYSATLSLIQNENYPHQVASMTVLYYMRIK